MAPKIPRQPPLSPAKAETADLISTVDGLQRSAQSVDIQRRNDADPSHRIGDPRKQMAGVEQAKGALASLMQSSSDKSPTGATHSIWGRLANGESSKQKTEAAKDTVPLLPENVMSWMKKREDQKSSVVDTVNNTDFEIAKLEAEIATLSPASPPQSPLKAHTPVVVARRLDENEDPTIRAFRSFIGNGEGQLVLLVKDLVETCETIHQAMPMLTQFVENHRFTPPPPQILVDYGREQEVDAEQWAVQRANQAREQAARPRNPLAKSKETRKESKQGSWSKPAVPVKPVKAEPIPHQNPIHKKKGAPKYVS